MSDLSEAIDRIDPEEWCADNGVDFRMQSGRSGTQINIRECPRCGGTSWKVFLNAESGLGNCFHGSCVGEPGFNIFSFAKAWLRMDGAETAKHLTDYAKRMGWRPKLQHKSRKMEVPDDIKLPCNVTLHSGCNIDYLEQRGVTGVISERFGLRYCEEGHWAYTDMDGTPRQRDFSKRIIIPVHDGNGRLVTFQGRDITGLADKKYLFPTGLPGTGVYLYNAHRVKQCENLVLGEGVFDVIAIDTAFRDFPEVGAIGTFGKHFSAGKKEGLDQLHELSLINNEGNLKTVTMMWDSEPATIMDACKATEDIKKVCPDVRIAILPPGCDPNEVDELDVRVAFSKAVPATKANIMKLTLKYGIPR